MSTTTSTAATSEWFPKQTLGGLPGRAAERWGERPAIVHDGRRWSHAELDREVDRTARALIGAGVREREHVAIWLTNRPEFLFLYYAIIKVGAVAVPLNTRLRSADAAVMLEDCDAATLVMMPRSGPVDYAAIIREVLGPPAADGIHSSPLARLRRIILTAPGEVPGALGWDPFLALADGVASSELERRAAAVDPDALATIWYTSGTTARPKGVMLSHRSIRLGAERSAVMGVSAADVYLNYLPLFHSYGLGFVALHSILRGASQVLMERFDGDEAVRLIAEERVTTVHGFDTHFRAMIDARHRHPELDLTSLRVANLAAGPDVVVDTALAANRELCPTVSAYGMSETATAVAVTFLDGSVDQRVRGSGYPLPGVELRIVDPDTGADLPAEETGEILVRYYGLMLGYYGQPEATREALDDDGWLHTGDMGLMRADGHLRFLGRYKDMLKVGGENVSPAEIEHLLRQMSAVRDVAVVGCPDPRLQEVPAAFLVTAPGIEITIREVEEFCRGKLASFKVPRRVVVVGELPMTSAGKVLKRVLRESLAALEGHGAGVA